MNKYERLKSDLEGTGGGTMKCFGSSMLPRLPNPSLCTYERRKTYAVGDIVFCKVRGRYIDAHIITRTSADGRYLISNNHGHDNGWTRTIYGRVVRAVGEDGVVKSFA